VLRAPTDGAVRGLVHIGDTVVGDQPVAEVDGEPVLAPFDGVLRGLVYDATQVTEGLKIGDVDPRGVREHCFTISEKALAIGGGVLEAVFASEVVRERLCR
jgi:xanthine dehydrogenase accessory factor